MKYIIFDVILTKKFYEIDPLTNSNLLSLNMID